MDLNNLKNTVSNLTLYDLKAGVRQLQNAVMNYTEMEAKVREATNNEPWGASSTLMQEIANGTFNYQLLNEIMPMIYHRFTEKTAEQWRQIYKALQLLEFLIKNGSERVIDDARSHLSLLKMLKQFHFIDQNGKDQGINVRNRSKELVDLLSDVEKIRGERKKAKSNKAKYGGYEGTGGMSSGLSSGGASSSRYGGFGSESGNYGGYDGRVYGDGGGFGGQSSDYQDTQARRDKFEEYDEYEEGAPAGGSKAKKPSSPVATSKRESKKADPVKAKQPEVDLFSFDDEPAPVASSSGKAPASFGGLGDFGAPLGAAAAPAAADDDDDFDDFQSAPTTAPAPSAAPASNAFGLAAPSGFAAPKPAAPSNDFFSSAISSPPTVSGTSSAVLSPAPSMSSATSLQPQKANASANYQPAQPNYFTSVAAGPTAPVSTPGLGPRPSVNTTPGGLGKPLAPAGGVKPKPAGDAFAGLLGGMGGPKKDAGAAGKSSMADLARQKASAGIWGAGSSGGGVAKPAAPGQPQQKLGGGLDDLLG